MIADGGWHAITWATTKRTRMLLFISSVLGSLFIGVTAVGVLPSASAGPDEWIASACPSTKFHFDKNPDFPRYAVSSGRCELLGPEGADDNVTIYIARYASVGDRATEIADFHRLMFPVMAYATRDSPDGAFFLAFAQAYTETPAVYAETLADKLISQLGPQGFSVHVG
jgi:hypothetical protein